MREELYIKFGETAEAAQLFETDLGTLLLGLEGLQKGWHRQARPEEATEFYRLIERKTLGGLLHALGQSADVESALADQFASAVKVRNRLNHGFFARHNFKILTDEGRDEIISDLETMHKELFDAWQIAQRLSALVVEALMKDHG